MCRYLRVCRAFVEALACPNEHRPALHGRERLPIAYVRQAFFGQIRIGAAEAIGQGLATSGVPYKLFHMATSDRNDVTTEVFTAKAVIVGSPTFNQGVLPTIAPILEDLKGLKFQNKIGAAFGSYGWSGESVKIIEEQLTDCKIQLVAEGVCAKWRPKPDDLVKCNELGKKVAQSVNA